MADLARRQENQHNKIWDLRDRICLQRRMLDLQLTLSQQNQISSGPEEMLAEQAQKEAAAKSKIVRALKNYVNTVSGVRVNRLNEAAGDYKFLAAFRPSKERRYLKASNNIYDLADKARRQQEKAR